MGAITFAVIIEENNSWYRKRILDSARFKEESMTASHEELMAMLEDRLASSTEEKIRRMRQAEIDRAVREYNETQHAKHTTKRGCGLSAAAPKVAEVR